LSPELIDALGHDDWRVRRRAVETLLRQSDQGSLTEMIGKLRVEHRDASVLNSVLQILVSMGSEALPALIEAAGDPDAEIRMYAALAIGDLKDGRAVPALTRLLRDLDTNVKYHAIEALSKLKGVEAAEAVDELAKIAESGDFFLAFPALDAIAAIGDPRVAPRLLPLLANDVLQTAVVAALAELCDETVVPSLVALMERPGVVPATAVALGRIQQRYADSYGEAQHIGDLIRQHTTPAGAANMLSMLNKVSGDTLKALVRLLGWVEDERVVAQLTRLLGSAEVRNEVIETLVRHGGQVKGLLCEQLEAEDLDTRRAAVIALARIGDPDTVPVLIRALSDPDVTVEAATALSKIGDKRAYEPLMQLVGHDRAAVRQAAIGAVNSLGDSRTPADVKKMLFNSNPHVRESAVRIAGYFGYPDCATQLLDRIHDVSENVRRAAVENLAHLQDDRIFDALMRASRDESPRIRSAAVQALGSLENTSGLAALVQAMSDSDAWVRYYAARSLAHLGSPEAIDVLAAAVRGDEANQVRIAAADALGSIGGARVVAMLAPLVESADVDLARAALNALGAVGHPDALHPITAALQSADASRRIDAVRALSIRRTEDAAATLESIAVHDTEPSVCEAAVTQLGTMATHAAIESLLRLLKDRPLRDRAITVLGRLDPAHVDRVAEGFKSSDVDVRRAIVEVLRRIRHPRASEYLSDALEDEAPSVRVAAIMALRHLGNDRWQRKLVHMVASDPDTGVREAAGKALER
jgi:HEAT repeat protein